jgi:hypothetical protein
MSYADANPIRKTDRLGLVVFENFPAEEERDAKEAVRRVLETLGKNPCCVKAEGKAKEIADYINSSNFTIRYKPGSKYCGITPFSNMIDANRRIVVGSLAWEKSCCAGGEPGINALASTILHEAVHGLYNTPDHATEAEKRCFGCGL